MKGLVGYNILQDDKSLIPNHLPDTLILFFFFLPTALTYGAFPLAAVHYCDRCMIKTRIQYCNSHGNLYQYKLHEKYVPLLQVTREISIMYCDSCALQQVGRKIERVSWKRWAATDYMNRACLLVGISESWLNSSICSCIPSGLDHIVVVHVLPGLYSSALASYPCPRLKQRVGNQKQNITTKQAMVTPRGTCSETIFVW